MLCVSVESMWEEQRRRLISQDASNTLSDAWWTSVLQNISMHSIVIFQSYPFQTWVRQAKSTLRRNYFHRVYLAAILKHIVRLWFIECPGGVGWRVLVNEHARSRRKMHHPRRKMHHPRRKMHHPDGRCTIPTENAPSRRNMHHPDGKCTPKAAHF